MIELSTLMYVKRERGSKELINTVAIMSNRRTRQHVSGQSIDKVEPRVELKVQARKENDGSNSGE